MQASGRNRWLEGMVAVPLALLLATACVAGPPDEERRVETIVIGEGADDPDFLWVQAGSAAFLGVQVEEETASEEGGARVTNVVQESPAETAGVKDGDVIVKFDGETVRGPVGLTTKIHAREPGDSVAIIVLRDGKKVELTAELAEREESGLQTLKMFFHDDQLKDFVLPEIDLEIDEQLKENMELLKDRFIELHTCEDDDCSVRFFSGHMGRPVLGVQLVETTPELRAHLGGSESAGVLVSKVLSGTPAREAGIMVGDLIVEVDGKAVSRSSDIRKALHGKQGEMLQVVVVRDGDRLSIKVSLPESEEDPPTGPRASLLPKASCAPAPAIAPAPVRRIIKLPPPKRPLKAPLSHQRLVLI